MLMVLQPSSEQQTIKTGGVFRVLVCVQASVQGLGLCFRSFMLSVWWYVQVPFDVFNICFYFYSGGQCFYLLYKNKHFKQITKRTFKECLNVKLNSLKIN